MKTVFVTLNNLSAALEVIGEARNAGSPRDYWASADGSCPFTGALIGRQWRPVWDVWSSSNGTTASAAARWVDGPEGPIVEWSLHWAYEGKEERFSSPSEKTGAFSHAPEHAALDAALASLVRAWGWEEVENHLLPTWEAEQASTEEGYDPTSSVAEIVRILRVRREVMNLPVPFSGERFETSPHSPRAALCRWLALRLSSDNWRGAPLAAGHFGDLAAEFGGQEVERLIQRIQLESGVVVMPHVEGGQLKGWRPQDGEDCPPAIIFNQSGHPDWLAEFATVGIAPPAEAVTA